MEWIGNMDAVTTSEKESKKGKIWLHGVIFCLVLVVIMLFTDWYVDSFYSIRLTYEDLAEMQLDGGVALAKDIDGSERKMKLACLKRIEPVEQMALGSSRSMSVTGDYFPGKTFFNMAVSGGGGINDYLSAIYWIDYYGKLPEEMLIEVSPAMFNTKLEDTQYLEWGESAAYMRLRLEGIAMNNPQEIELGIVWKDVVAPSYFRANFEQLRRGKRTYAEPVASDIYDTYYIFRQDGSWMYSTQTYGQYTQEMIAEETERIESVHDLYQCGGFYSLSEERKTEFEKLMQYLAERGVKVSFYLPPYSPMMYAHIAEDESCHVISEVENYVISYAKENGLKAYGSYDPALSDIEMEDFFDPYHLWEESVRQTMWER